MNTYSAKVEERIPGVRIAMIKEQTEIFRQFLSDDRADGAKKAFYEVNIEHGLIQALDTKILFDLQSNLYRSQGYTEYRTFSPELADTMYDGIRSATLHIFTHTDKSEDNAKNSMGSYTNIKGEHVFDSVSWFFDYCPGSFDRVIAEVSFIGRTGGSNTTPKKKKRK